MLTLLTHLAIMLPEKPKKSTLEKILPYAVSAAVGSAAYLAYKQWGPISWSSWSSGCGYYRNPCKSTDASGNTVYTYNR